MRPDSDLTERRKRAVYRAGHRGTRELDILIGRYAMSVVPAMHAAALTRFETFLERPEPELQAVLLAPSAPPPAALDGDLIAAIRCFHGLDQAR